MRLGGGGSNSLSRTYFQQLKRYFWFYRYSAVVDFVDGPVFLVSQFRCSLAIHFEVQKISRSGILDCICLDHYLALALQEAAGNAYSWMKFMFCKGALTCSPKNSPAEMRLSI